MNGWRVVHDDLLTFLPTLVGLTDPDAVSDGPSISHGERLNYASVGDDGDGGRGFYEQDYENESMIAETGEVAVRLVSRSGDTDLATLHDTVDGWVMALRMHYAADKRVGDLAQSSVVRVGRVLVQGTQTPNGAIAVHQVAVAYFARF